MTVDSESEGSENGHAIPSAATVNCSNAITTDRVGPYPSPLVLTSLQYKYRAALESLCMRIYMNATIKPIPLEEFLAHRIHVEGTNAPGRRIPKMRSQTGVGSDASH